MSAALALTRPRPAFRNGIRRIGLGHSALICHDTAAANRRQHLLYSRGTTTNLVRFRQHSRPQASAGNTSQDIDIGPSLECTSDVKPIANLQAGIDAVQLAQATDGDCPSAPPQGKGHMYRCRGGCHRLSRDAHE